MNPTSIIAQVEGSGALATCEISIELAPETILVSAKVPRLNVGCIGLPLNKSGPANWVKPKPVAPTFSCANILPVPNPIVAVLELELPRFDGRVGA